MSGTDTVRRRDARGGARRRSARAWVVAAAALVVVAVLVVGGLVWPGWWQGEEPAPAPSEVPTVVGAPPTPALTPVDRSTDTELAAALPDTVLEWALTAQESVELPDGALLGYRLTYSDGEQEAVVEVVQWPDADLADEALAQVEEGLGEPLREGEVTVDGGSAGRYVVTDTDAAWTNGTVVLHLRAPSAAGRLYDAYPL